LSADEVRSLALPGTRLTWRFLKHDGYADWTLVLVDEQDAIVWVHRKGFFPDGYEQANIKPAPEPADQHDGHEPWMDEGLIMHGVYCVTLIQDVTPDEALRRFGAADNAISTATWRELLERACYEEIDFGDHVVAAFALGPHALLVEDNGSEGAYRPDLSAGTFAVSAYRSINADTEFLVSREGVELASMHDSCLGAVEGDDPGVLTEALEEMGIDDITAFEATTDNFLNDLELLRKLTSVNPTIADVTGPARAAIIAGTP
jgi:hypothetical protein